VAFLVPITQGVSVLIVAIVTGARMYVVKESPVKRHVTKRQIAIKVTHPTAMYASFPAALDQGDVAIIVRIRQIVTIVTVPLVLIAPA